MELLPTREEAQFTDENDHNPLIRKVCPECKGYRKRDIRGELPGGTRTWTLTICKKCAGKGWVEGVQKYFENDSPAIPAKVSAMGYVQCPCCGWKFSIKDKHRWTGRRHMRCGQKITLT
jgi:hypothetical protein